MKRLPLAEVVELPGQKCFDVLWVDCEDYAIGNQRLDFRRGRVKRKLVSCSGLDEAILPEIQVLVLLLGLHRLVEKIKRCNWKSFNACLYERD